MSPERAHNFTFSLLSGLFSIPGIYQLFKSKFSYASDKLERQLFGLTFPNPVGLAAGFDKDAILVKPLSSFGFGFIEIGTVTPLPQAGNPQPRLFRLPEDQALINRMGFNNQGVEEVARRLKQTSVDCIIGGNIGKNKSTPNQLAYQDYLLCFETLYPLVHYFVINVSSPNTPGLRELQEKEPLTKLIDKLQQANRKKPVQKPILLKIAPDLNQDQLDDIIEIVKKTGISGIVATNTTIDRNGLTTDRQRIDAIGMGGLSGRPLGQRSTEVIRYLHEKSAGSIPIIGVGGINSPEDAIEKLDAGASLVQIYTGFIYQGPSMVRKINQSLATRFSKSRDQYG
jgi:dihydroorotate dehydrogenase